MPTISTTDYLLDQAKRRITTSPILTVPGMGLLEKRLLAREWPQHAMAEPPAGSDLKPVMGDGGLPILGHMVEMFRGGPDFWLHLYRNARARSCCSIRRSFRRWRRWAPTRSRRSTPTATRTTPSRAGLR